MFFGGFGGAMSGGKSFEFHTAVHYKCGTDCNIACVLLMVMVMVSVLLTGETVNQVNSNKIKCCFFGERGKPEYAQKNLSEQSGQPTNCTLYDAECGNKTRDILVKDKRSHY